MVSARCDDHVVPGLRQSHGLRNCPVIPWNVNLSSYYNRRPK